MDDPVKALQAVADELGTLARRSMDRLNENRGGTSLETWLIGRIGGIAVGLKALLPEEPEQQPSDKPEPE